MSLTSFIYVELKLLSWRPFNKTIKDTKSIHFQQPKYLVLVKVINSFQRTTMKMSFQDVKFAFKNRTLNSGRNNICEGKQVFWSITFHWHPPLSKKFKCRRSVHVEINHSWFCGSMSIPAGLIICNHPCFLLRHAFQSLRTGLPNS